MVHVIAADERDATWERDDARFRLFVYDGPGNAVTTLDLVDASVEEALEYASMATEQDARLWSLALVEDDARGLRGLIWLSGMDYNDPPGTAREWRRRRQMQDRYLAARSRRGERPVLPNGMRLIRVFAEWVSGWPLWENFSDEYRLTAADLGLSSDLGAALYAWNEAWLSRDVEDPVPAGWKEEGHALVRRLRAELDGVAEVRPDFWA